MSKPQEEVEHFRRGQLVRFLNGPVMRVLEAADESDMVCCMWLDKYDSLEISYIPEDFLIHASMPVAVSEPPANPGPLRQNPILRCCSLVWNLIVPPGGNVR